MKGFNTIRAAVMLVTAVSILGCVKQRERIDAQGVIIDDQLTIARVHGMTCKITTKDKIQNVKNSMADVTSVDPTAMTTLSDGTKSRIIHLDIVDYDTNCPYLGDNEIRERMELRAQPYTTYPVVFEVAENYVTVYKLVTEDQISHLEVPYSKFAHGYWYVPIGGWNASFYRAEMARNADNRDTNQRISVPVRNQDYLTASHVALDVATFKRFQTLEKVDALPRDFFDGEWYFAETVVNTSYQSGEILGGVHGLLGAEKVKFLVYEGNIFALDVNVDEELAKADNHLNFISAVKIPAELKSYRRALDQGLQEVEHSNRITEDADFVELNFVKVETPKTVIGAGEGVLGQINATVQSITVMKDLIVNDGFLSFTIEDNRIKNKTRYTFMRTTDDRSYTKRRFFVEDMRKFGFFASFKNQIADHRIHRREDTEHLYAIARYNPEKDIVYHFSDITPGGVNDPDREKNAWIRDVGRESINLWQQAFKRAGLKINIRLDESQDVALGDIRYNVINLVGENVGSIIGYGPSLTDPWTGEVVSATANTFLAGIREGVVGSIRAIIAKETKRYYEFTNPGDLNTGGTATSQRAKDILTRLAFTLQNRWHEFEKDDYGYNTGRIIAKGLPQLVVPHLSNETAVTPAVTDEELRELADLLQKESFGLLPGRQNQLADSELLLTSLRAGLRPFYKYYTESMSMRDQVLLLNTATGLQQASARPNTAFLAQYVQNHCPEVVALIERVNATGVPSTTEEENAVILPCSRTFEMADALSTTVHEIGHNLGLRHNFNGSADVKNFLPHTEFQLKYVDVPEDLILTNTGSIMDYVPASWGIQVTPGGYDIAALRFGYASQVELAGGELPGDGEVIAVPNDKSLDQFLAENQQYKIRNYGFCTDEDAYLLKNNPFCTLHDMGSSAVEITTNLIYRIYDILESTSYRYDKNAVGPGALYLAEYSMELKRFYEQWRLHLREFVNSRISGDQGNYLESLTLAQYKGLIDEMLKDPNKGEVYRDFYAARSLIFNFWLDVATMPNRYCVAEHERVGEKLYELELIRKALRAQGSTSTVRNCNHPEVQDYLARNGFKFVEEVGHFLNPGVFSLNPNNLADNYDFAGTLLTRLLSSILLGDRGAISLSNYVEGYYPSFLDEPDSRAVIEAAVQTRITHGVNWNKNPFDAEKYAVPQVLSVDDYIKSRKFVARGGSPFAPTLSISGRSNFEAEAALVFNTYALLLDGLNAPSFNPSDDKRVPYIAGRMSTVDLQEILNDPNRSGLIAEYIAFSGNTAIYAQPGNTFAIKLIQLYKSLSGALAVDGIDTAIYPVVQQTVDQLAIYSAEGKVTFGDVLKILITMESVMGQLQQAGVPYSVLQEFVGVFAIENVVFNHVLSSGMLSQFGITTQDQFNSFINYFITQMQNSQSSGANLAGQPSFNPVQAFEQIGLLGRPSNAATSFTPLGRGVVGLLNQIPEATASGELQLTAVANSEFDKAIAMDLTKLYKDNNLLIPSKTGVAGRITLRHQEVEGQQLHNRYYRNEINAQLTLISSMLSVGASL